MTLLHLLAAPFLAVPRLALRVLGTAAAALDPRRSPAPALDPRRSSASGDRPPVDDRHERKIAAQVEVPGERPTAVAEHGEQLTLL